MSAPDGRVFLLCNLHGPSHAWVDMVWYNNASLAEKVSGETRRARLRARDVEDISGSGKVKKKGDNNK